MTEEKKLQVVFEPGCFDGFEGTQEELDELITEIHRMIESGELFEKSQPLDMERLEEEDPELAEKLLAGLEGQSFKRNLQ